MKSTGEVMGSGREFGEAVYKSLLAAGSELPQDGTVLISVRDADKPIAIEVARRLVAAGFEVCATSGTHAAITDAGVAATRVNKLQQGQPHILDRIKSDEFDLVINTTEGRQAIEDSYHIRQEAIKRKIPYTTTIAGALAMSEALRYDADGAVYSLADMHRNT
ncbi:MAG: hypothetical protein CSA54_05795 [Gammaproteobacteria bacterium]|nr:MAG: hypothetical protein CSA54_05795 [Gammaproteobacteria bacterium]